MGEDIHCNDAIEFLLDDYIREIATHYFVTFFLCDIAEISRGIQAGYLVALGHQLIQK